MLNSVEVLIHNYTFINCKFYKNSAYYFGGGLDFWFYAKNSIVSVINTTFQDNFLYESYNGVGGSLDAWLVPGC